MSGNIKVAIRVRPLIKQEKDENSSIQWITQGNTIVATDPELRKRADGRFEFDHIFDMNTSNNDVFHNVVRPIIDAAVSGFNGTVFAYGQMSSGKTYTMMGTSAELGVIPLSVEHVFNAIANTGREFLLRVSYLEIYNEKVIDLLGKDSNNDLKIHEDANGQVFVKCKEEITNCPETVLSIINKGNKKRRIGKTNMNERSSRSHTIFRITIESREAGADSDGVIQVSRLNMVDLAGSERALQTDATKEQLKEGCHINSSLSTLSLVINQLNESQDHISFRESKLTRLLQDSLGGNTMTVMICVITPAAVKETQNALAFASRARNIKNKPELNEVMSDGVLLKRYTKQIDKLHAGLERMEQLIQTIDFQEMESKMQEKDRINQNLEERIRLLQTQIIISANRNNAVPSKIKEKRRQTWCGGGYKTNTSIFPLCTNLSPIKEMSSLESHSRKSTDMMNVEMNDTSFQVAFPDFELELINSVTNRDEENEESNNNDSTECEKIDKSIQTESYQSPGTPGTLKKQLYVEDQSDFNKKLERCLQIEKQLENITSQKHVLEKQLENSHAVASELRKKLTAAELRYTLAEDQLNAHMAELQRIPNLEKKAAQLSAQEIQNVPELQEQLTLLTAEKERYEHVASELRKKLKKAEQRNLLLEDKLTTRNVELEEPLTQLSSTNETFISSEKNELQCKIIDLQDKLTETELSNNSMKNRLDKQQLKIEKYQAQKKQVAQLKSENYILMSKNQKLKFSIDELQKQLIETKVIINEKNDQMYEHQVQDSDKFRHLEDNIIEKVELERMNRELNETSETNETIESQLKQVELINDFDQDRDTFLDTKEEYTCSACGRKDRARNLTQCSRCMKRFHVRCAQPQLSRSPTRVWVCPKCTDSTLKDEATQRITRSKSKNL